MRKKTRVSGWEGCGYSIFPWAVSQSMIRQPINSDPLGCEKSKPKCPWAGQLHGLGLEWT